MYNYSWALAPFYLNTPKLNPVQLIALKLV